jgi:hypothetical protein
MECLAAGSGKCNTEPAGDLGRVDLAGSRSSA